MAIITDPDDLNQGTITTVADLSFTSSAGVRTVLTGATTLPLIADQEFFEIRGASIAGNDGLYIANGAGTTSSLTADKIDGPNPTNAGSASANIYGTTGSTTEKSIHIDTSQKRVYILDQGELLTTGDGVTEQAFYSFLKEEWRSDPDHIQHEFPMVAVTPEQFEFSNNWEPRNVANGVIDLPTGQREVRSKKLLRTGGWSEIDDSSILQRQYTGVITLGSFEDSVNDTAYYQLGADPTDLTSTTDFSFNGPVNEAILVYENVGNPDTCTFTLSTITRATGSFVDDGFRVGGDVTIVNSTSNDGTYTITGVAATTLTVSGSPFAAGADVNALLAVDNRRAVKLFLRIRDNDPNGKTFSSSDLPSIGAASGVDNKVFRFPLSNATDLDISTTDAVISSSVGTLNDPFSEIRLRYLSTPFQRDVGETGTANAFGIVVDVGSFSQADGASDGTAVFTWNSGTGTVPLGVGEALADYTGGTLELHEGTDKGTHTISGTPVDNAGTLEVTLGAALTGTESGLSFTITRATPLTANVASIYEKIQYQLRQAADIDATSNIVAGKTADSLAQFVGPDLRMGSLTPNNPNGGGSGVIIQGFDSNDTNNLFFFDNSGTSRSFPFVAAGSINFNPNLVSDTGGSYWMFFTYTEQFTQTDFAITASSGTTATLTSGTVNLSAELSVGQYIQIAGFTNVDLNGIYVVTGGLAAGTANIRRIDGTILANEAGGNSVTISKNPVNSPGAIIVENNSGSPINGAIGASSVGFDFDYDNNTQGGRTSGTNAAVTLRGIGFETAQFVEATGTITRSTGLSFSLVSGLERNYSNPL